MQHKIPICFGASGMREGAQCERISTSPHKRSAWKKFIFEQLEELLDGWNVRIASLWRFGGRTRLACRFRPPRRNHWIPAIALGEFGLKVREGETPSPARYKRALPRKCCDVAMTLLAMPRLRDVLNPWLAHVSHQHKGQSVCVWPAELVHA